MTGEDEGGLYSRLNLAAANLIGSVAAVGSIMEGLPQYESARDGWLSRIEEVSTYLEEQVEQIQGWGEAFDL